MSTKQRDSIMLNRENSKQVYLEVRQYEFSKRVLEFWKEKDELEKLRKIQTMKAELKQMMHSLEIDQLKLSALQTHNP